MKKTLRPFALLLCLIMLIGMMAGCGTTGSPSGASPQDGGTSGAGDFVPGKLVVGVYDRGNMSGEYGTPTENRWTKWVIEAVKEETGVEVEFLALPRAGTADKINAMMAAREAPDIIFDYSLDFMYGYAKLGGLAPLDEAIDSFGANLVDNLGWDTLEYGKYEGTMYAIPARRSLLDITGHFIRTDWLEKAGYTLKTNADGFYTMSVEDLEEMMGIFKASDFDSTGQEIFPIGMSGSGGQLRSVQGILDVFHIRDEITEEMQATQPQITWPGAKDGLRWLNEMYNLGYIDPDYGVQGDTKLMDEYISTSRSGYLTNDSWYGVSAGGVFDILYENTPEATIASFVLENVHGKQMTEVYNPIGMLVMVPSFSTSVNEAIIYLNWLSAYENYDTMAYGVEGEHYELDENGIPMTIDAEYNSKTRISVTDLALTFNGDPQRGMMMISRGLSEPNQPVRKNAAIIGTYGQYVGARYSFFNMGAPNEASTKYSINLADKIGEIYVKSIMAPVGSFDTTFDTLVQEYMQIGGNEVAAEAKQLYDAWKASQ
ncbi:MAG: extracellular solute-binding protein [Christensenellales bacterium]|jgi:putative aldouronate transport system substrate-binding protein